SPSVRLPTRWRRTWSTSRAWWWTSTTRPGRPAASPACASTFPGRDRSPATLLGECPQMSLLRRATPDEQFAEVTRATVDLQTPEELKAKLRRSYERQQPLVGRAEFDPNRPDLHRGPTLGLA